MTWSPHTPKKVTECIPQDTRGPKRLWDVPAGWVIRTRGDTGGTRLMEFCCPVHGRFTVEVPRGEDADEVACPARLTVIESVALYERADQADSQCARAAPWSPSTFGIWASAGEVMS